MKHYQEVDRITDKKGMSPVSRESYEPGYCQFSSESEREADPVCELVRRKIADLGTCPLKSKGRITDNEDNGQTSILDRPVWQKTKN